MRYMGKSFRSDDLNQALLLPPSLHDWLPEKHLARFLVDVVETLELSAIYASYEAKDSRGRAAYAPEMMLRLLLYGYCVGVYSSRKIETRTYEDLAFRFLSADEHPDHDTIADFRRRHREARAGLFTQALLLCEKAGLVKLGPVAIEGPKIKANASKHKAMSYARMGETDRRAGLWPDQGAARLPALQPAWPGQCSPRVETGVPDVQPAEAVRIRMAPTSRLNSGRARRNLV